MFELKTDRQKEYGQQTILHPMSESHVDVGARNRYTEFLKLFEGVRREWQVGEQQTGKGETEHD